MTDYDLHLQVRGGKFGFAQQGHVPGELFGTLEEAIQAQVAKIRYKISQHQTIIKNLEHQINQRLTHIGILEIS